MKRTNQLALVMGALAFLGCGEEDKKDGNTGSSGSGNGNGNSNGDPDGGDDSKSKIVYPNSFCDDAKCEENTDAATVCDGNGEDDALPDCNAWVIRGKFGMQAVNITGVAAKGTGRPQGPPAGKKDDDTCPEFSMAPAGDGPHCCQRTDTPGAYKLTGLVMDSPPVFAQAAVSTTNDQAISEDRYNWMMKIERDDGKDPLAPGDVTLLSGSGLHNTDGSFVIEEGVYEAGGRKFNEDGAWDAKPMPGTITDNGDGTVHIAVPTYIGDSFFTLPMWTDPDIDYVGMSLSQTGMEMSVDFDKAGLCGSTWTGLYFELPGTMKAFLPLGPLVDTNLVLDKANPGGATNMCQLTANVIDCSKPRKEWEAKAK